MVLEMSWRGARLCSLNNLLTGGKKEDHTLSRGVEGIRVKMEGRTGNVGSLCGLGKLIIKGGEHTSTLHIMPPSLPEN